MFKSFFFAGFECATGYNAKGNWIDQIAATHHDKHADEDYHRLRDVGIFASREAVRYSGLDITVHQSDARRAPGRLSRQGPSALRWALFEAAQCARRPGSPDHDYYRATAARLGGNRACLAVARKLLKRSYHTLRELGEEALRPA